MHLLLKDLHLPVNSHDICSEFTHLPRIKKLRRAHKKKKLKPVRSLCSSLGFDLSFQMLRFKRSDGNTAQGTWIEAPCFASSRLPQEHQREQFRRRLAKFNWKWRNLRATLPHVEAAIVVELLFCCTCLHPRVLTILSHKVLPTSAAI